MRLSPETDIEVTNNASREHRTTHINLMITTGGCQCFSVTIHHDTLGCMYIDIAFHLNSMVISNAFKSVIQDSISCL